MKLAGGMLCAEYASTAAEREAGLSGRDAIGPFDGMLFSFADDRGGTTKAAFWMKNTKMPLDLVLIDERGRVSEVIEMEPCTANPCPVYQPATAYRYALEIPRGDAARLGVTAGTEAAVGDSCSR